MDCEIVSRNKDGGNHRIVVDVPRERLQSIKMDLKFGSSPGKLRTASMDDDPTMLEERAIAELKVQIINDLLSSEEIYGHPEDWNCERINRERGKPIRFVIQRGT